jgi:hypothetical protein
MQININNLSVKFFSFLILIFVLVISINDYSLNLPYQIFWIVSDTFAQSEEEKDEEEKDEEEKDEEEKDEEEKDELETRKEDSEESFHTESISPDYEPYDYQPSDTTEEENYETSDTAEEGNYGPSNEDDSPNDESFPSAIGEPEDKCQRNPQFTPYEKSQFNTDVQSIVEDLIDNNPNIISNYSPPLTALSNIKLKIVLLCLDAYNLKNVLLNIPASDLITIYNRIISTDFNNRILGQIPYSYEKQIKLRIFNYLP